MHPHHGHHHCHHYLHHHLHLRRRHISWHCPTSSSYPHETQPQASHNCDTLVAPAAVSVAHAATRFRYHCRDHCPHITVAVVVVANNAPKVVVRVTTRRRLISYTTVTNVGLAPEEMGYELHGTAEFDQRSCVLWCRMTSSRRGVSRPRTRVTLRWYKNGVFDGSRDFKDMDSLIGVNLLYYIAADDTYEVSAVITGVLGTTMVKSGPIELRISYY